MAINFGKYTEEASSFFKDVAVQLETPNDIDHAFRVTRAVLHTLRERISPEESMHVISQLPMLLKGIYVDGWKIKMQTSGPDTVDEFLDEVRAHDLGAAARDFGDDQQGRNAVVAVLTVMKQYVNEGELKHIRQQLPQPIAALFD